MSSLQFNGIVTGLSLLTAIACWADRKYGMVVMSGACFLGFGGYSVYLWVSSLFN